MRLLGERKMSLTRISVGSMVSVSTRSERYSRRMQCWSRPVCPLGVAPLRSLSISRECYVRFLGITMSQRGFFMPMVRPRLRSLSQARCATAP